ncbi:MAG: hypothetical protein LBQ54_06535 [Planctomycetaceae bacterium]|jgi:hypothetical protein|nr:hypothetical protein [Planctomycetaceae bacterium]
MRFMKLCYCVLLFPALGMGMSSQVRAAETQPSTKVSGHIESVALFKNGLVTVRESIAIPGPGRYRLEQVPKTVHGTFFIESDFPVETLVTTQTMENDAAERKVPVMIFEVGATESRKDAGTISLFYLTKGITWSPSYWIDISDPNTLTIETDRGDCQRRDDA